MIGQRVNRRGSVYDSVLVPCAGEKYVKCCFWSFIRFHIGGKVDAMITLGTPTTGYDSGGSTWTKGGEVGVLCITS